MKTIDIGSHGESKGDIDIDILPQVKPTIVADAHHLPFRSNLNIFGRSSHAWEYFTNPVKALQEFERVVKEGEIVIPHWLNPYAYYSRTHPRHINNPHMHIYVRGIFVYIPDWLMKILSLIRIGITKPIMRTVFKPFFDAKFKNVTIHVKGDKNV